jgi:Ca-activated chloride channel homolog
MRQALSSLAPAYATPSQQSDRYESVEPNPVLAVVDQPASAFSVDIDTMAYANVRRFLNEGGLPVSGQTIR